MRLHRDARSLLRYCPQPADKRKLISVRAACRNESCKTFCQTLGSRRADFIVMDSRRIAMPTAAPELVARMRPFPDSGCGAWAGIRCSPSSRRPLNNSGTNWAPGADKWSTRLVSSEACEDAEDEPLGRIARQIQALEMRRLLRSTFDDATGSEPASSAFKPGSARNKNRTAANARSAVESKVSLLDRMIGRPEAYSKFPAEDLNLN